MKKCDPVQRTAPTGSLTRFLSTLAGLAALVAAQAQPTISNVAPDGSRQFQYSPTLTFQASSAAGVTNVTVHLTGTTLTGVSRLRTLTIGSGLTSSGPATALSLSGTLTSNLVYSAQIQAQDASGQSASTTVNFDTILPVYTFEAEDFDYTVGAVSGKFIDNPQTNAYANVTSTDGVDCHNGTASAGHSYRPNGPGTEGCGDKARAPYIGTGLTDYDVGWNDGGNWANYTRTFPAGKFNIYMRGANPNGRSTISATLAGSISGALGQFSVPTTGSWQTYTFVPLTDAAGNLVEYTGGGVETLTLNTSGGNYNANFYLLLPPYPPSSGSGDITVASVYPDGAVQFQGTNTLSFTVTSSVNINTGDIVAQLNATNLTGQGTSQTLQSGSGLTVGGTPNARTVSLSLTSNTVYNLTLQVSDVNSDVLTTNLVFDTITPAYTFEAEDWNYTDSTDPANPVPGLFIDNPQTNAYSGLQGTEGIDFHRAGGGGGSAYGGRIGLATENASDVPREAYVGTGYFDFDIGNAFGGNWANYTRTFPLGIYNLYVRSANGNSGAQTDAGSISLVTGASSSNQTASVLGTFDAAPTGGWQRYTWAPVKNSNGDLARFTGGGVKTLRYTVDGGSHNPGFFMLMPADLSVSPPPYVSDFKPAAGGIFQMTNVMTFTANSAVGLTSAGISVKLNGINVNSSLTFGGSPNAMTVSCPVDTNKLYTAIITLTDAVATTSSTNGFDTFDPATYVFEAEDYDYTDIFAGPGQFIDNAINAYNGLPSTFDVDEHDDNHQGNAYRPSGNGTPGLEVEVAGDVLRAAYNGTGFTDYNLGYDDAGNWANYTHTYPAGTYNAYMRIASPNNAPNGVVNPAKLSIVTSGRGTSNQTLVDLGTFAPKYTGGWHAFNWTPLVDNGGALVRVQLSGAVTTLRSSVVNGGYNVSFYALVPADLTIPVLSNVYPNGAYQFQASSTLSFTASSTAGINPTGISVQLTYTDLLGHTVVTNLTSANGLTITGPATSPTTSLALGSNRTYTAVITVTSVNGRITTSTLTFDTITPAYLFEAEDWNYTDTNTHTAGLFFDNPQTNAYAGRSSTIGVDSRNSNGGNSYRPGSTVGGLATENCGDVTRQKFIGSGFADYDVGYNDGGDWADYTRTFPAGVYNVYLRGANGGNTNQINAAGLSLVTSGLGTSNQTLVSLGTFSVPGLGWQVYLDVPLIDRDGNYAEFVGGAQETLRVSTLGGNYNANYYFLMPADNTLPVNPPSLSAAPSGANVVVSFLSRTNTTYQMLFKSQLTDAQWSKVGSTIPGNSLILSITNAPTGGSGYYRLQTLP